MTRDVHRIDGIRTRSCALIIATSCGGETSLESPQQEYCPAVTLRLTPGSEASIGCFMSEIDSRGTRTIEITSNSHFHFISPRTILERFPRGHEGDEPVAHIMSCERPTPRDIHRSSLLYHEAGAECIKFKIDNMSINALLFRRNLRRRFARVWQGSSCPSCAHAQQAHFVCQRLLDISTQRSALA
ncbi:hypothetical protein CYLTODRAFT_117355 [Cylindrobasidium torrendii FP15055 ss-10]|uniref:Uncharacterized protein n=1 Tax=Cylindrobasidium torrendii FP15055 ss-10 TaxID=1314674 RepID=A0A0D7BM26_9AGAR|nr:hypothetical protein CYLTODRAFT_117355 [Cylindrobasidium torrendii FP15055 ss-10]